MHSTTSQGLIAADSANGNRVHPSHVKSTLSRGNCPNYAHLAITGSGTDLHPGINNALAKSIAVPSYRLVQAAQHKPCRRKITTTIGSREDRIVRPAARNPVTIQRGKRKT